MNLENQRWCHIGSIIVAIIILFTYGRHLSISDLFDGSHQLLMFVTLYACSNVVYICYFTLLIRKYRVKRRNLGSGPQLYISHDGNGVGVKVTVGGYISRTIDNGNTWVTLPYDIIESKLMNLDGVSITTDSDGLWTITLPGSCDIKSIDNGLTWFTVENDLQ